MELIAADCWRSAKSRAAFEECTAFQQRSLGLFAVARAQMSSLAPVFVRFAQSIV